MRLVFPPSSPTASPSSSSFHPTTLPSRNPPPPHNTQHTTHSMSKMCTLLPPCLWVLYALVAPPVHALQTTQCDTTEAERARVTRNALKQLADSYEILPGSLSFPDFAQPAGRYGLGM